MRKTLAFLATAWIAAATAAPAVVGDGACPDFAIDIAAFATCDGDRVARHERLQLAPAMLVAEALVPQHKRTNSSLYVDAARAYALKRAHPDDIVLVDIRSGLEVSLTGHAESVDMNVAYHEFVQPLAWDGQAGAWKMTENIRFAPQLDAALQRRGATHDTVVMLLCRSGEESPRAGDQLSQLGYRRVVSVIDGFEGDIGPDGRRSLNGWKNAGLPWTARVDTALFVGAR